MITDVRNVYLKIVAGVRPATNALILELMLTELLTPYLFPYSCLSLSFISWFPGEGINLHRMLLVSVVDDHRSGCIFSESIFYEI